MRTEGTGQPLFHLLTLFRRILLFDHLDFFGSTVSAALCFMIGALAAVVFLRS
jgi:ABC-type polysaccharide/polyol phosphate export permease